MDLSDSVFSKDDESSSTGPTLGKHNGRDDKEVDDELDQDDEDDLTEDDDIDFDDEELDDEDDLLTNGDD